MPDFFPAGLGDIMHRTRQAEETLARIETKVDALAARVAWIVEEMEGASLDAEVVNAHARV